MFQVISPVPLFVLNSCWVHSSNLKERALKSSKSMHRNSEVSEMKFLFYLPFLPISFTLAGCCSRTDISANIACSHTHVAVKFRSIHVINWASLVAQLIKNQPAMWETWVLSWVRKLPREGKGYLLQCSGLKNSTVSQRVGHDWALSFMSLTSGIWLMASLFCFSFI